VYSNITIGGTDSLDFASIVNFLYVNRAKLINITLSANYKNFVNDYQFELSEICKSSNANGGSLKFGSETASVNGSTIIFSDPT